MELKQNTTLVVFSGNLPPVHNSEFFAAFCENA